MGYMLTYVTGYVYLLYTVNYVYIENILEYCTYQQKERGMYKCKKLLIYVAEILKIVAKDL